MGKLKQKANECNGRGHSQRIYLFYTNVQVHHKMFAWHEVIFMRLYIYVIDVDTCEPILPVTIRGQKKGP